MSRIKLDLKQFEHVKSDKESTTLRHKDGHVLTIAHSSLSEPSRKQLQALNSNEAYADGGPTEPPSNPAIDEIIPDKGFGKIVIMKKADGGEVGEDQAFKMDTTNGIHATRKEKGYTKMAMGGGVDPYAAGLPCLNPNCKSHGKPHPNCRCYSGGEAFAEGGSVSYCSKNMPHKQDCQYFAHGTVDGPITKNTDTNATKDSDGGIQSNGDAEGAGHKIMRGLHALGSWLEDEGSSAVNGAKHFVQTGTTGGDAPQDPASVPAQADQASQSPQAQAPDASTQQAPDQGMAQKAPAPDQSTTQSQEPSDTPVPMGKASAPTPETPSQNMPQADLTQGQAPDQQGLPQGDAAELKNEAMQWEHDLVNQHITPETYSDLFAKKSTLGKIGSVFGMLLSGAGSGLAHQQNMAFQMMDNEIQRDLEAQKSSKANAHNYLQMNYQHELQQAQAKGLDASTWSTRQDAMQKAFALSRMQMNVASAAKLADLVKNLPEGSPQRAQATQAMSLLYSQMNDANSTLADRYQAAKAMTGAPGAGGGNSGEGSFQQRQSALEYAGQGQRASFEAARHIPGVPGMASRDVPEEKRQKVQAMKVLDNKLGDLMSYAQQHKGSIDPKVIAIAKQKAEESIAFLNQSVDNLGMTPGRLGWLEKQISASPTNFFNQLLGSQARLGEIKNSNSNRMGLELKALGFPEQKKQAPAQSQTKSPISSNTMDQARAWLADPKNAKSQYYDTVKKQVGN